MPIASLKREMKKGRNAFVVWSLCYLWFISLYSIIWAMFLFFTIRETLWVTGTDLINLFVLLSGLFLVPSNIQMLSRIANGGTLDYRTRILCCPTWLYLLFIVVINLTGAALCARKIHRCHWYMREIIAKGMEMYKTTPRYKNFIDNLQWTLKCCGVESYSDWFSLDWLDQIRDYDYDVKKIRNKKDDEPVSDSVPLSCCKSGTCYPHYLTELGASTINKTGCVKAIYRILMVVMILHLVVFISIAIVEMAILYCTYNGQKKKAMKLISKNEKFRDSSNSRTCRMLTDFTSTDHTDFSEISETDLSELENSIKEIRKSIDCVTKLCGKEKCCTETEAEHPHSTRQRKSRQCECESDDQVVAHTRTKPQRKAMSSPDSKTLSRAYSRGSQTGSYRCPPCRSPPLHPAPENNCGCLEEPEDTLSRTRTRSNILPKMPQRAPCIPDPNPPNRSQVPPLSRDRSRLYEMQQHSQCASPQHEYPHLEEDEESDDPCLECNSCCESPSPPCGECTNPRHSQCGSPCWSVRSHLHPQNSTETVGAASITASMISAKLEVISKKTKGT